MFGIHIFIKPLDVRALLGVESTAIASLVVELSDIWGALATISSSDSLKPRRGRIGFAFSIAPFSQH